MVIYRERLNIEKERIILLCSKHYYLSSRIRCIISKGFHEAKIHCHTVLAVNGGNICLSSRRRRSHHPVGDIKGLMEDFFKPKIMYSEIVRSPQFYLDEDEHFLPEATTFIMTGEHLAYLITFFNSPLVSFLFKRFYAGGGLGEEGFRYKKQFFENLPIPKPPTQYQINDLVISKLYGLNAAEVNFIESQ